MRKILSLILVFALVVGLVPATSVFAAPLTLGDYQYTLDGSNNATITKYIGTTDVVVTVPSTLDGNPVVAIGDSAFALDTRIVSITIPSSVTAIGDSAFLSSTRLQNVIIQGAGLVSLGNSAFWGCISLQTVSLPNSLLSIGSYAFFDCSQLTSIAIPSSVQTFGVSVFKTSTIVDATMGSAAQIYAKDSGVKYYVPVSSVAIDSTSLTLTKGDMRTLTAVLNAGSLTSQTVIKNPAVSWSSSNTAVATVSPLGALTAVSNGTATITVTSADGGFIGTCVVTVSTPVVGITITQSTAAVQIGRVITLSTTVNPLGASVGTFTWTSNNPSVATVSSGGIVTGISNGTATITVSAGTGLISTSQVTVTTGVTSVSLNQQTSDLFVGRQFKFTPVFTPIAASNQKVIWYSSNPNVATVDTVGNVTAVSNGTTVISVVTEDGGYSANSVITVTTAATGMAMNKADLSLGKGMTEKLTLVFTPATGSTKAVTWTSSDTAVATVSNTGLVTGVDNGTAVIKAVTTDGTFTATSNVTVVTSALRVVLSKYSASMPVGGTTQLTATVFPLTTTNKSVTWQSSDTSVATVSETGLLRALKIGTAVITVKTADGSKTDTLTVTVDVPVTSLKLSVDKLTVLSGKTGRITATVLPVTATNKKLMWSSDKKAVATVDEFGVVTGVSNGTAKITAKTENGALVKQCVVTVKTLVSSLKINVPAPTLVKGTTGQLAVTVSPATASIKAVKWTSSNTKIATVTAAGLVKGIAPGKAVITATATDGSGVKVVSNVTIVLKAPVPAKIIAVSGVKLSLGQATAFVVNGTYTFKATVSPANATDKTVKWSTSDASVATVSSTGVVKILKAGTAVITVKTSNGKTDKLTVVVK